MISRFTNIILRMIELKFSKEDIDTVIDIEVKCTEELEWISENIKGPNAREQEAVTTLEYYNSLEDEIFNRYI